MDLLILRRQRGFLPASPGFGRIEFHSLASQTRNEDDAPLALQVGILRFIVCPGNWDRHQRRHHQRDDGEQRSVTHAFLPCCCEPYYPVSLTPFRNPACPPPACDSRRDAHFSRPRSFQGTAP